MLHHAHPPARPRPVRTRPATPWRPALALITCALLNLALTVQPASAQPATQPITYQGRLEQNGAPVTQVRNLRFELFDAPQGGAPLATFDATGITITDGLFTVPLAFPAGVFEGTPRHLQVTLLPLVSGQPAVVLPRQLVGSAPRAESVRGLSIDGAGKVGVGGPAGTDNLTLHGVLNLSGAGAAIRFSDGTIQATAAVTPPPGPQLSYLPGTEPVVDLSGEPVTLAEPISVSYEVAETQIVGTPTINVTLPGKLTVSPVVVRRPFTGNTAWRDVYLATITGPSPPASANLRSVRVLSLTENGTNDCSFSLSNLMVVGYRVYTVGTAAFEELRLNQTTLAASVPVWTSGATGNGAKFLNGSPLGATFAGAPLPGIDVQSYESSKEVVAVTTAPGAPTTYVLGRTIRPSYVFRTPFGSKPALGAWFASAPTGLGRQRAFSITGPGGFSLAAYANSAWVHTYRIVPGPSGEITEEWSVTSNFIR